MPRYFIEVSYIGKAYAGFQKQQNANTVQGEIEKALYIYFKNNIELTGSSRTDAGVHAIQNFFHFDSERIGSEFDKSIYHLNAILPADIVIQSIKEVPLKSHCRFDATFRRYQYQLYIRKNPFLQEYAYFYPYKINKELLHLCAEELFKYQNFETFSKRNSQVYTYNCFIQHSNWHFSDSSIIYTVQANRFLRGMVKGLVGTMLKMASQNKTIDDFKLIIESGNCTFADFSVPSHGLTLVEVGFV